MVPCIQPRKTAAHCLNRQRPTPKVFVVDACDLDLSPCRRFDISGNPDHVIVIKIESWHRIIALWFFRLFLNGNRLSVLVKLHNTILSGITHIISKYRSAAFLRRNTQQQL